MSSLVSPLDDILGTRSKIRILRTLLGRDASVSGRQAARLAGVSAQTAQRALEELEQLGIVDREVSAAEHHFTINHTHYLVKHGLTPLFRSEERSVDAIFDTLQRLVSELALEEDVDILSGIVFGSVAREEDRPRSDLDLLIVVSAPSELRPLSEGVAERTSRLADEFGLTVSPLILPLKRLLELRSQGAPLAAAVENEGRRVFGQHPSDLFDGSS